MSRFGGQTPASIYLQWLHTLLLGESSSGNPLGLSTIAERYPVTVSHLLGILGETNPASMSIDELEDIYSDLTSDNNPTTPIRHLTQGLRDFHRFLQKHYKIAPIRRESEILGNDASLKPVDANLISFDDYIKIQHWLDSEVSGHDWGPCKLVCMLAFQCGMRRMEIFGLRLEDIQLHGIPHIVIQPHSQRGLKTKNSQRIIPARVFLSPAEINFLRTWIAQRKIECFGKESSGSDYLFAEFGNPKKLTWVNRIYRKIRDAIRAVTGDELLYLHHLRHAFATWNYLRLRAPDHPMILRYFDPPQDLEHTCAFLKNGKRARILLMGASRGPRRAYAFAIAKLLGHASPAISLGHYIHASDLLLGAAVWRESRTTPKPVLIAASIRGKSVIYDHLDNLALPEYISSMVRILNTQR